jgi:large subunit ribosomal protein L46
LCFIGCSAIVWNEALLPEGFKPAPRETEADATGDVKTRERKLKTRVYLAVQDATDGWSVPTTYVNESETLLDAAKRAVPEAVGTDLKIYCPSNCPMAVDMKVYDKEEQTEYFGEKIFFFRVQWDDGDVVEADMKAKDYGWLAREEMTERVKAEKGDIASKFYHYFM